MRLSGKDAIDYATLHNVPLYKYADPIEGARRVTEEEAYLILREDPSLIWVDRVDGVSDLWSSAFHNLSFATRSWASIYGDKAVHMPGTLFRKFLLAVSRAEYLLEKHVGQGDLLDTCSVYGWCHNDWSCKPTSLSGHRGLLIFYEWDGRSQKFRGLRQKPFSFNYHREFPCGVLIQGVPMELALSFEALYGSVAYHYHSVLDNFSEFSNSGVLVWSCWEGSR